MRGLLRDTITYFLQGLPPLKGKLAIGRFIGKMLTCPDNAVTFGTLKNGYKIKLNLMQKDHEPLYYFQSYETEVMEILRKYISYAGAVFFDIGASVGIYSIGLCDTVKTYGGKIYAFEPLPTNFDFLQESIILNKLENVVVPVAFAVGKTEGILDLRLSTNVDVGNAVARQADFANKESNMEYPFKVKMVTLDKYISDLGIKRLDAVKMDIEGFEYYALCGFSEKVNRFRPIIYAEFNQDCMKYMGIGQREVEEWLSAQNYVKCAISEGRLNRITSFPKTRKWDLFLFPREKEI